ncbi:MAG: response regulator [Chitinispirillales bacterium]|jgi:putative two-component system response regulator|nr:response regulator [Chitinispirillales bacterium]
MKTIFVVDDSDTCLIVAEEALESEYRVITLSCAAKMFAMLDKITPDLILMDICMPEIDGFTALELLKKNMKTNNIPVIFLSGQTEKVSESRGFELGAVDFILKPFSKAVLNKRVKTNLDTDAVA